MKNLPAKFCISCSKIVPCKPIFKKNNFILGKCTVCGLAFILNPPNSKDLKNLYSFNTGYKKRLLNNYFEDDFKFSQNYVDLILNSNLPGKKILDVGCSAGFFLKLMKDHNYDTCGVELSEDLAKIGRNNFNLKIKTGKIEDIKEKFDLITFFDVIEHIENPDKDLNKAYSLLNDNGYLIISTPNIDGLFPKLSSFFALPFKHWPHPEPPFHLFQFSVSTLKNLLLKNNFQIINIIHNKIPIDYSFGSFNSICKSVKRMIYSLIFIPIALIGPFFKKGDVIIILAKKVKT